MNDSIKRIRAAVAKSKIRDVGEARIVRFVKEAFDGERNKAVGHIVGEYQAKLSPILCEIAPRGFASDPQINSVSDRERNQFVRQFWRELASIWSTEANFSVFRHSEGFSPVLHPGQGKGAS